jgi:hypothetical protein
MPKNWAKLLAEVNEVATFDHVCVLLHGICTVFW